MAGFLSRHLAHCHCSGAGVRRHHTVRAALVHFGEFLRDAGFLVSRPAKPGRIELEVERFDNYLRDTAGLQESTRTYRRRYVGEFLNEFFGSRALDLSRLTPERLISYLSKRARGLKPASSKVLASSLRSYLRFLLLYGRCEEALILAVPAPASWRLSSLPSVLTDEETRRLLAAFDRSTNAGLRDYAITRCLLDLGLRAREVAHLGLDDIDWRKGVLRIVGTKSRRDDELPLTAAIGSALAAYIQRGRPQGSARRVFLQLRPPIGRSVTSRTIADLIIRAATRTGMNSLVTGTRILRHTAATRMLCHGASIKEIADVLRHRCLDTTAIYTKVNLPELATVALPWPQRSDR
jgi:site-specific recombinase XerD